MKMQTACNCENPRTVISPKRKAAIGVKGRIALQIGTILVHLFIIRFTVPNIWWALFGAAFWGGVIWWAAKSGRWVCANFCWLGGVQDLLKPLAKKRVRFNPKISQMIVLTVLVGWTPLVWLVTGSMTDEGRAPIGMPLNMEENFFVQAGHFFILTLVGFSVMIFGTRGACHYLCPFGIAVSAAHRVMRKGNDESGNMERLASEGGKE